MNVPTAAEDVIPFLHSKLNERCESLQCSFRMLDASNNGVITAADFEEVLRHFGVRLTRQGLAELVSRYDANSDGSISWQEFCAAVSAAPGSSGRPNEALAKKPRRCARSAADRVEEQLRRILYASRESLTTAFLKMDRNRDGYCDAGEIEATFRNANIDISPDDIRALIHNYDADGDGKINIRELARLIDAESRFDDHGDRATRQCTDRDQGDARLNQGDTPRNDEQTLSPDEAATKAPES